MPAEQRLKKTGEYAFVYEKGSSWTNRLVVMKAVPNGRISSRYGISVSKRLGTAVVRNRVKRLLREILRLTPIKVGWDIILIARPAAAKADYSTLKKAVGELLTRAQLLKGEDERVCLEIN